MIDLHMHSRYSEDGEYSPRELVEQCAQCGIDTMSVTDHNCARANEEAQAAAKEKNIRYIPGIEIDCVYSDANFHVLGYEIDFRSEDFKKIEDHVRQQSLTASMERLEKTRTRLGFSVTEEELYRLSKDSYWQESWPGELFAEVLLDKPEYLEHELLRPYRTGGARSDNPYVNFYWDYYSQGKSCYAGMEYPSMKQVVDIIHRNGGKAVLAHPGVNLKGRESLLDGVLALGMDGIEAFSSYHTQEQAEFFSGQAKQRKLSVTCGSDYHGKTKPSIHLGQYGTLPGDST